MLGSKTLGGAEPVKTPHRRALERRDRLVHAGRELMRDTSSTDFALQDVAERARTSLRAFYEHFTSKDDLLLAVFSEAIRESAQPLSEALASSDDPVVQLGAYVDLLFRATFDDVHPETPAMIGLHLHLARTNPEALAAILAPQNEILVAILSRGVASGAFRNDLDVGPLAMLVSQVIISTLHTNALSPHLVGVRVGPEELRRFCVAGVIAHRSKESHHDLS